MLKFPEELMFIKNGRAEQKHSDEPMTGKLCVITGASSGVGYESAKALAAGGADIVMVVRNEEKAKAVKEEIKQKYSVQVDYIIADFSDLKQVKKQRRQLWRSIQGLMCWLTVLGYILRKEY